MKKVVLIASYSVIEPLSLLHLSTVAEQEGWNVQIRLLKEFDSSTTRKLLKTNSDLVGLSIYIGNHSKMLDLADSLRKQKVPVVVGGPHASYFPEECLEHADAVVAGEGFRGFRQVLQGKRGLIRANQEKFPIASRENFYAEHPEHGKSYIKSVITGTGCPYRCTYCYNSVSPFPKAQRSVDDIIEEVENIRIVSPDTRIIYFQDDVFGANLEWLRDFVSKYQGLPFHAQMRFEMANPYNQSGKERIDLLKKAGCTGLTFAIESASSVVRDEILNRKMTEALMFDVFLYLKSQGFKVRTEQMLGLPLGKTSVETPIELDADLDTLALNVELRKRTGLPDMAWASIFVPYRGTKIWDYCVEHGFYSGRKVPETFFEQSILDFSQDYKTKMMLLRDLFNYFALVPEGHKLARDFLEGKHSFKTLSSMTKKHLYDQVLYQ